MTHTAATESDTKNRRYGMTVDALVKASGRSRRTIFNWLESDPWMLDAVSLAARHAAWAPSIRQTRAKQVDEADGLHLPLYPTKNATPPCFPEVAPLMDFMFSLSGVDLWLLRQGLNQMATQYDSVALDESILLALADMQVCFAGDDGGAAIDDIQADALSFIEMTRSDHPSITPTHLLRRAVEIIDMQRQQQDTAAQRLMSDDQAKK